MLRTKVHVCPHCGRMMQRDLMSAYLAAYVDDNFNLIPSVESDWASAKPLFSAHGKELYKQRAAGTV